jgi:hypothetical protein
MSAAFGAGAVIRRHQRCPQHKPVSAGAPLCLPVLCGHPLVRDSDAASLSHRTIPRTDRQARSSLSLPTWQQGILLCTGPVLLWLTIVCAGF